MQDDLATIAFEHGVNEVFGKDPYVFHWVPTASRAQWTTKVCDKLYATRVGPDVVVVSLAYVDLSSH